MTHARLLIGMVLVSSSVLVIAPMLPTLQERSGFGVAGLGVISGVTLVAALLSELLLAPHADRGHERLLCVGGIVLAIGSLVWSALAGSLWELVVSRALSGVAYAAFIAAAYAVVIRSDPDGVGQGVARIQAAEFAGLAAGPLLGAVLEPWLGVTGALLTVGALTAVALPVCLRMRAPATAGDAPPPAIALDLLGRARVWPALLLAVAVMVPVGAFDAMWARYLTDLGGSRLAIALSFAATTLPFIVLAGWAGRLVDRVGPVRGAMWGGGIVVAAMTLYAALTSVWAIIGVGLGEAVGQALIGPAAAAAMAHATGPARAASGQGVARAVGMLVAAGVAVIAGPVYDAGGGAVVFGGAAAGVALLLVGARALASAVAGDGPEAAGRPGETVTGRVPVPETGSR